MEWFKGEEGHSQIGVCKDHAVPIGMGGLEGELEPGGAEVRLTRQEVKMASRLTARER